MTKRFTLGAISQTADSPRKHERTKQAGTALLVALVTIAWSWTISASPVAQPASASPMRIISLVPSVSEMLFAIGEGRRLVGVSNYDRFPPEVSKIPRVGGLVDPDVERILGLRPDLVVLYGTQTELIQRLDRTGIPYFSYVHRALPDIAVTMRAIGERIGAVAHANTVATEMERSLAAIREATSRLPHPTTLLVFGRDPASLRNVYASGGYGFLNDMLEVAGGTNVFGDVKQQSVQASTELLLTRRPEVIIELRYGDSQLTADVQKDLLAWNTLASVPAVKNHRVHALVGDEFVVPGPRVIEATRKLARTLHPESTFQQ
jgi:iron complex transport system substrate-binding protein